jgi:N-succinyldiaminopimelate aminotransferase
MSDVRPHGSDAAETTIFDRMTRLAQETGALNLGQGFPDEDGPAAILDAAQAAMRAGHNQYAPLAGVPALREAIAAHQRRRYGIELDPDGEVQVTFGATEAIASALLGLLEPDDEVAMLDPSYDSYVAVARLAGATPRPIVLRPPDWRVTAAALDDALTSRTRMLLLNTPHNPTGRVLDRDELELLATAARERDLLVVSDEVYEHMAYETAHVPIATLEGMARRTLTISSLGKMHSLTGWKVGWASGPRPLVAATRNVKQFLTYAGGTPFQHAAAAALALDDEIAALTAALRVKRDRLAAGLAAAGFDVLPTEGTYFLTVDPRPLGEDDAEALCLRLPVEAGVVAIPTSVFCQDAGRDRAALLRLAFCKREQVLDEAVARLAAWAADRGPVADGRRPEPADLDLA